LTVVIDRSSNTVAVAGGRPKVDIIALPRGVKKTSILSSSFPDTRRGGPANNLAVIIDGQCFTSKVRAGWSYIGIIATTCRVKKTSLFTVIMESSTYNLPTVIDGISIADLCIRE